MESTLIAAIENMTEQIKLLRQDFQEFEHINIEIGNPSLTKEQERAIGNQLQRLLTR